MTLTLDHSTLCCWSTLIDINAHHSFGLNIHWNCQQHNTTALQLHSSSIEIHGFTQLLCQQNMTCVPLFLLEWNGEWNSESELLLPLLLLSICRLVCVFCVCQFKEEEEFVTQWHLKWNHLHHPSKRLSNHKKNSFTSKLERSTLFST